jgi:sulfur carrier protein ThiS
MVKINFSSGKIAESNKRFVKDILKEFNILEHTVLVTRNDELLTPDTLLKKNDEINIISVVSGG